MYNLMVTYTEDAWEHGKCEFRAGRVIEGYGDPSIFNRYKNLDPETIAQLKTFPCLLMYEDKGPESVYLGWLKAIRFRNGGVKVVEVERETSLVPWPRTVLAKLSRELDPMNLTHC